MVSSLRVSPAPPPPSALPSDDAARPLVSAYAYLARLASLRDEAAETAHLANLLGRAPRVAVLLGVAALATVLFGGNAATLAPSIAWLALVAVAVAATAVVYRRAIGQPFASETLRGFSKDFSAILLYAGFAWGAGLLLALPRETGAAGLIAFTAGASALVAWVTRARDVAFCFLAPATAMGAFAALMRPAGASAAAMLAILAGGVAVATAIALAERLFSSPFLRRHG